MAIRSEVKGERDYSKPFRGPEILNPVPIEPDSSEPESYRLPKTNQSDVRIIQVDFDLSPKRRSGIFSSTNSLLEDFIIILFIGFDLLVHLVINALAIPALVVCGIKPLLIGLDRDEKELRSVDLPNISPITGE